MGTCRVQSAFFEPDAVAIVGASEEPGRIGSGLCKSIAMGFTGEIFCVNPKYSTLWGRPCYASVLELPKPVSHAIVAVARRLVPQCLRQCAEAGIPHVVVVSAGFKEADAEGAAMEAELTAFCRERGIALLGPNTLGFLNTAVPFNGTFLPAEIARGRVSVISQSGGVGMALLSALRDQRCGVAKWVGIGNEAVLDAVDFLRYFAQDPETKAIAVCFEGLRDLPGFLRLAGEVNRHKPVLLLRDGKSAAGMRAAASHTGTMAQDGAVMEGLIAQYGLLEAKSCRECAAMLKALSLSAPPAGNRAAILTNTAGPSILAADGMEPMGVRLPQPSAELTAAIDREAGLRLGLKNPADISSNGLSPQTYGIAARQLLASEEYDVLLGFFSLNPHLSTPDRELTEAARRAGKPAVACFLCSYEEFFAYDRRPESAGIPCFCDSQDAAAAVAALVRYGASLARRPAGAAPILSSAQREAAARFLESLAPGGGRTLPEADARRLLALAGAEIAVPVVAETPRAAAAAAAAFGYPVALKLHSETITHKSDVGGVRLNLRSEAELLAAYGEMLPALQRLDPAARLTVQPMAEEGFELILGAVRTAALGPLVMAGMGGVYSEILQDTAFRMLPLDGRDPAEMLSSLRCAPVLEGFRGPALDQAGVCDLIRRLADLMEAFPQIAEVDLNPCRVYADRVAILDARVVLEKQ